MTDIERCERCQGELGEAAYRIRMDFEPPSESMVSIKVCDYCRKSFTGWVARKKKSGSSRSSSSSERADSSTSSRRSSSTASKSSSESSIPSAGKLLEAARGGFSAVIEAAAGGMIDPAVPDPVLKTSSKRSRKSESEDEVDDLGLDAPSNYLVTIGVVLGVFIAIGLVLSYITG